MADEKQKIVIIGGGAIGLSIAYHLGCLGVKDVVLLERHQLTSGTSWHAAGIVGPLRASMNLTQLAMYALDLFTQLEQETGQATGYRQTGGVWLAQQPERMIELARIKSMGDRNGLSTSIMEAEQIGEHLPLLNTGDLKGGLWVDQDGQVNPVDLCMAYARAARALDIDIREACPVSKIEVDRGKLRAVQLDDGNRIECEQLVLAAGAWSRELANTAGVELPLVACEHMYVVTDTIEELPSPCPIIRDLDAGIYLKGDSGKAVLGTFETNPKPWVATKEDAPFLMFDEDWEHAQPMLEAGIHRAPLIADHGITHFMNGPECFTPDTRQLMGEIPQCENFFIAAGFNSIGIMSSAGVGKVMADWVCQKQAPMDLWEVDVTRVDPLHCDTEFLQQRLPEAVHNQFDMHWPYKQFTTGRDVRHSPWHSELVQQGAVMGAPTGWERPLYYVDDPHQAALKYSYSEQDWWQYARDEAIHCQQHVSLFELSPFTKIDLVGKDALIALQKLCCSDMDIESGRVLYTLMLNQTGGIEAEITVTRLQHNHFRIVSGAATRFKDMFWLQRHLREFSDLDIIDVTEDFAVLGVMGPDSRDLMASLSNANWSESGFPFSHAREASICGVQIIATRLSFVGEPGWELYIPVAAAERVLQQIIEAGKSFQLGFAGHFALDSCRLEMGYRHWGHDMGSEDTPYEAGLGFAVNLQKADDFFGKQALIKQQEDASVKKLRLCEVEAPSVLILHDEPVYSNQGIVGHCTSGGPGFRSGKMLCFVLFYNFESASGFCEIELAGERYPIHVLDQPPCQMRTK